MNKLFIPKKINVGFQARQDTYTKKLAYVIYWDDKGKLRKEKSWNSWRNNKISPEEFENVPTDGFVLNKKAGGYSSGWNHRQTYCRVYDPRGFEFEITIPNLLFILQECNAYKGKGLEGEFVYAWDGTDLALLPAHCKEYQDSLKFTELQHKKVGVKDLVDGCFYKTKKNEKELMYLGKFNYISDDYGTRGQISKRHVFFDSKKGSGYSYGPKFIGTNSLTFLAEKITDTPSDEFSGRIEEFSKSKYSGTVKHLTKSMVKLNLPTENGSSYNYWGGYRKDRDTLKKKIGSHYLAEGDGVFRLYTIWCIRELKDKSRGYGYYKDDYNHEYKLTSSKIVFLKDGEMASRTSKLVDDKSYTDKEIRKMGFVNVSYALEGKNQKATA